MTLLEPGLQAGGEFKPATGQYLLPGAAPFPVGRSNQRNQSGTSCSRMTSNSSHRSSPAVR